MITNKKVRFNYTWAHEVRCGMMLTGWEAKAIRKDRVDLTNAYVQVKGDQLILIGCRIDPLPTTNTWDQADPARTRILLVTKAQLKYIKEHVKLKTHGCVPISMEWANGRIKLNVGLAIGKKQHDKRETIKARDLKREQE